MVLCRRTPIGRHLQFIDPKGDRLEFAISACGKPSFGGFSTKTAVNIDRLQSGLVGQDGKLDQVI
jgi:hypothetical protein